MPDSTDTRTEPLTALEKKQELDLASSRFKTEEKLTSVLEKALLNLENTPIKDLLDADAEKRIQDRLKEKLIENTPEVIKKEKHAWKMHMLEYYGGQFLDKSAAEADYNLLKPYENVVASLRKTHTADIKKSLAAVEDAVEKRKPHKVILDAELKSAKLLKKIGEDAQKIEIEDNKVKRKLTEPEVYFIRYLFAKEVGLDRTSYEKKEIYRGEEPKFKDESEQSRLPDDPHLRDAIAKAKDPLHKPSVEYQNTPTSLAAKMPRTEAKAQKG